MDYIKIIPCLDVKDGRLVKGVNFVDLKDVGDPAENGEAYSKAGADELVFLDITATIEKRKTMIDAVKRTVNKINVPLTVGGGIGSTQDIQELLDVGVSFVIHDLQFIQLLFGVVLPLHGLSELLFQYLNLAANQGPFLA